MTIRLLEVIGQCVAQARDAGLRQALGRQADMIHAQSQDPQAIPDEHDRSEVRGRWEAVRRALVTPPPRPA